MPVNTHSDPGKKENNSRPEAPAEKKSFHPNNGVREQIENMMHREQPVFEKDQPVTVLRTNGKMDSDWQGKEWNCTARKYRVTKVEHGRLLVKNISEMDLLTWNERPILLEDAEPLVELEMVPEDERPDEGKD